MVKDCPNKKDKGKVKVKKEAISNISTELSQYDALYINTLAFGRSAARKMTRPTRVNAHHAFHCSMFINGKEKTVLLDTGTIGANLISADFVSIDGIPCIGMNEPTKIPITKKGSRSGSHKECRFDQEVHKGQTKGNKRVVGNLAKYDSLIGVTCLRQHGPIIECGRLAIHFPKLVMRIKCTLTSCHIRAGVITTQDVMDQHTEVFPEVISEDQWKKYPTSDAWALGPDASDLASAFSTPSAPGIFLQCSVSSDARSGRTDALSTS